MILIYAFFCWLIFSYYGSKLVEALQTLHVGLIKASMFKEYRQFRKSEVSEPLFSNRFNLYPKTWRSLWSELLQEGENLEVMAYLALKTGLKDYCLKSQTRDVVFQAENIAVLCALEDFEARTAYLESLSEDSKVWKLPILPLCFRHKDVALKFILKLLTSEQPRKANCILDLLEPTNINYVLLQICQVNHTYRSFAVGAATRLEGADQGEFISAAKSLGVDEVPFVRYFLRFSKDGQQLIRTLYPKSSWWYSRLVLRDEGEKLNPPPHIAWFYNRNERSVESTSQLKILPEIHIAA